jgi:DnaJ-class molecular chaperone
MPRMWDSKQPGKSGGSDYRPPHDVDPSDEPLACGNCHGTGTVTRKIRNNNSGWDWDDQQCSTCNGTGTIS